MPVGFLITSALVVAGMGASLWPPARSGLAGMATWIISAIPNESPFLLFYWFAASTCLAYFQGDLHGAPSWITVGVVILSFAGTPVLVRRSLRAAQALEQALDRTLGPEWRGTGSVRAIAPSPPPWARVALMPLPILHPGVKRTSNLRYGPAGRRNRLDLYRRRDGRSGGPVLIHLHGGGFSFLPGRKSFYARRLLFRLARRGWVCISATYRLQPTASFPDELIDVKKAIAWARVHASEYGGDPEQIVLAGSSFGARLAALAAFTQNDPAFQPGFEQADTSLAAAVGLYGYYGGIESRQGLPSSPFDYATRGSAPLLIVHGGQDTFTPPERAATLAERARKASRNPVVYVELPGAQHSFDLLRSIRLEAVIDGIEAFATSITSSGQRKRSGSLPSGAKTHTTPTFHAVASADGTKIGFERLGTGPVLVLVQGGMGTAYTFRELAQALADSFTVIVPDRRGRGLSPRPFDSGYTIGVDVADLDAVLRATGGRFVFGLSSGADIVLEAALSLSRIERLALCEPAILLDGIPEKGIERFNAYVEADDLPGILVAGMKLSRQGPAIMRAMPDWLVKPAIKRVIKAEEKGGAGDNASMAELAESLPYDIAIAQSINGSIAKFKGVKQPVLLLGGSKSPDFLKRALDELEQIIPDTTRVEITGVDHAAAWNVDRRRNPHGNPTAVAKVLKTYFTT